jgi:hypothetical protein
MTQLLHPSLEWNALGRHYVTRVNALIADRYGSVCGPALSLP